jgi:hypothetical protein
MKETLSTRVFGRRRNILVDRPYQHRLSLMTALMALLPPALFFGIYSLITTEGSRRLIEANPALENMIRIQNRTESLMILSAVLFYGIGVYLVTLLESHRTAGFIRRINGRLKEIFAGKYAGTVSPRRDDHFHYLATTVNKLSEKLQQGAEEDLTALDKLAENLDGVILGIGSARESRAGQKLHEVRHHLETMRRLKSGQMEAPANAELSMVHVNDELPSEKATPLTPDDLSG